MVSAGQVLAEYGNLGYSMGAHLHFEVWIGGRPTDPELFFAEKGL
jgi:murein DD-endopeptidase MepM/ murein hydrolase activator NlpD